MSYQDARPWAKAIEVEVLERRMPPWGAVKGFGDFRNDQALTQEQLELITNWVDGGAPEGNPNDFPPLPKSFPVVHEKFYHVFVVSQDLSFFVHTHPERGLDEDFHLDVPFPKPGMYRVLSDFHPAGGTPQLTANTVMIPGDGISLRPAQIRPDVSPRQTENSHVELDLPGPVIAREKMSLLFRATPDGGIEPYLGAMAHMLAASSDLIDMMHSHPFQSVDGRANAFKELTFNMIFPREGIYRVWVQFQRIGIVNTVSFDVPVQEQR